MANDPKLIRAVVEDRDALRARLRAVCQTAVEAIGARGPMDAEEAVTLLADDWHRLRAERWTLDPERAEDYTADAILRRVVEAVATRPTGLAAWSNVGKVTGLGSGYATKLCRHYGVDPWTETRHHDDLDEDDGCFEGSAEVAGG